VIPNEAVEAAKAAYAESLDDMRAALEAAAPHMLNLAKREAWDANVEIQRLREETRLAHVDAVVNAETVDRLQAGVDAVLALHRELPCLDEDGDPIGGSYCEECKDLDDHSGERVHEVYPCMTVREIANALDGKETYTAMRDRIEAGARREE